MTTITMDEQQTRTLEKSIQAMTEFKMVFGRGLSGDFIAELHVARILHLKIVEHNQPGYDAIGQNGERYQIKYRDSSTQNVNINNFDFDFLILVNLDEACHLSGLWRITVDQAQEIFTYRPKFLKFQATQTKFKRIAEVLPPQNAHHSGRDKGDILPGRSWSELRGAASYPLMGEDAQQWVSRTRQEDNRGLDV